MTTLSASARKRGLIALLADTFFMWGGFFMVIPLIGVHYVDDLGWLAADIGLILALRQLAQQGLTLFGGMLADKFGAKWLICAGMLVRVVGFVLMAHADTFGLLLISSLLAALGGALFESPKSAAIAALTEPSTRSRYFAIMGVVGGLGMTIGPLAGAALLRFDFAVVAYSAAACFVITFLINLIFVPSVRVAAQNTELTTGLRLALLDGRFLVFTALLMGYWFMWVQLTMSLPLEAKAISHTADAVSLIYALNSGMSVLLQYPILRLFERWLPQPMILVTGLIVMAVGLGAVALAHTMPMLLLCVALFSLGALLVSPTQQSVMANLANPAALGSYFGVGALALAFGGGFGNFAGGWLYDIGQQQAMPALPWICFALCGLLSAAGLWWITAAQQRASLRTEQTASAGD